MKNDLSALIQRLQAGEPKGRLDAVCGIAERNEATPEVIAALTNAMCDASDDVSVVSFQTLAKLGPAAWTPDAVDAILTALQDTRRSIYVRGLAGFALGDIGPAAGTPEVLAGLVAALTGEQELRHAACDALGKLGQPTPEVLGSLLAILRDTSDDKVVRGRAAQALGNLGAAAATPEVVAALTTTMNDKERSVREHAERALSKLGPKGATPEVLRIMSEKIPMTLTARRDAPDDASFYEFNGVVTTIGLFGAAAATPEILAALTACLKDDDDEVSALSAYALGEIGPRAATPEVISALTVALTHEDSLTRRESEAALTKLGRSSDN